MERTLAGRRAVDLRLVRGVTAHRSDPPNVETSEDPAVPEAGQGRLQRGISVSTHLSIVHVGEGTGVRRNREIVVPRRDPRPVTSHSIRSTELAVDGTGINHSTGEDIPSVAR